MVLSFGSQVISNLVESPIVYGEGVNRVRSHRTAELASECGSRPDELNNTMKERSTSVGIIQESNVEILASSCYLF